MKKICKLISGVLLSVALIMGPVGCATMQRPTTAVEQIMQETHDPAIVAQAAYLDLLIMYNHSAQSYITYFNYMEANHPDVHEKIIKLFTEMNRILNDVKELSELGAMPDEADLQDFSAMRRKIVQIMLDIEARRNGA